MESDLHAEDGQLHLRLILAGDPPGPGHRAGGWRGASGVHLADAYGPRRTIELRGTRDLTLDTNHAGGWYDLTLSTPQAAGFAVRLAGRLESAARLTSDPQLGTSSTDRGPGTRTGKRSAIGGVDHHRSPIVPVKVVVDTGKGLKPAAEVVDQV